MALDEKYWNQHALANKLQTLLLLLVMACLMFLLGFLLWANEGIIVLAVTGVLLLLFNPGFTPKLIMQMYSAVPLSKSQAPLIYTAVQELSRRAGLTTVPVLYYVPSSILNAFTVGRRGNACIGISDGLLQTLNAEEIVAVLAHEISHIRNNDMSVMGLADMFSRLTSMFSLFGQLLLMVNLPLILLTNVSINWFAIALLIFSPTICSLAQLGLSRTREYDADLNAARLTGNSDGLVRALVKIEHAQNGWLERLFLPGRRLPEPSLLRTHPPTKERVRRLMELKIEEEEFPLPSFSDRETLRHLLQSRKITRRPRWHFNGLWH